MDKRVLESLTTCALYPYLESDATDGMVHSGVDGPTGSEFPDDVAIRVLKIPPVHQNQMFFAIGFNLALSIAGRICEDPTHSPALDPPLAEARAAVAEQIREAAFERSHPVPA